ncbi:hypothetical protein M1N05_02250 [Dehalococcoidales bacterium]|nr:hypothetical protein [Dehalococcoidales bacterium]
MTNPPNLGAGTKTRVDLVAAVDASKIYSISVTLIEPVMPSGRGIGSAPPEASPPLPPHVSAAEIAEFAITVIDDVP